MEDKTCLGLVSSPAYYLNQGQTFYWVLGAASGFAVHRLLLIRGEWHIQSPSIITAHIFIFLGLLFLQTYTRTTDLVDLFVRPVYIHYGYLTGLTFSVVIYRVFLHPLTKAGFPCPWYAPISKVWNVWAARHRKNHLVMQALHQIYGDFVRTGMSTPLWLVGVHCGVFMSSDEICLRG